MSRKAIPKELRQKLKEQYECKCGYCGTPLEDKFHIDHKHPHFNGGSDKEKNLMATCVSCNLQKGGRTLEDFRDLIADKLNQLKLVTNYEVAKRYNMIKENDIEIVFEFENCLDGLIRDF